ncbi:hypothetical protein BTVI_138191 [Pitangus sulphuratus]|nr:hypothetical protein BTVI_138191 [Pitangus sulphuratus]
MELPAWPARPSSLPLLDFSLAGFGLQHGFVASALKCHIPQKMSSFTMKPADIISAEEGKGWFWDWSPGLAFRNCSVAALLHSVKHAVYLPSFLCPSALVQGVENEKSAVETLGLLHWFTIFRYSDVMMSTAAMSGQGLAEAIISKSHWKVRYPQLSAGSNSTVDDIIIQETLNLEAVHIHRSGSLKSQVLLLAGLVSSVQKSLIEALELSCEEIKLDYDDGFFWPEHGWVRKEAGQNLARFRLSQIAGAAQLPAKNRKADQQQQENFPKCLSHASGRVARHDLDVGCKERNLAARLGSWQAQQQYPLLPKGLWRNSNPNSVQDVRDPDN